MKRNELLNLAGKNFIANNAIAEILARGGEMMILEPAVIKGNDAGLCAAIEGCRVCYDADGLHVIYHDASGEFTGRCKSAYAVGDYVYVRESFYEDDGKVRYLTDWKPGGEFLKHRVTISRYMPKKNARLFFRVRGVKLKRLFDLNSSELRRLGVDNYVRCFALYDSTLSERKYAVARSEVNPYVFVYDIEVWKF